MLTNGKHSGPRGRRLRLMGRLRLLRELCSHSYLRMCRTKRPVILVHLPYSHAHSPQTPTIFTRPQFSGARHLHTPTTPQTPAHLHTPAILTHSTSLDPRFRKTYTTMLNIRHLQLSNACLRIGMEDDILHFPEGVHKDDVVGTGLV